MKQERDNPNPQMDFGNLGRYLQLWYFRRVQMPFWTAKNALHYSLKVKPEAHKQAEQMTNQFALDFFTCLESSSINNIKEGLKIPTYDLSLISFTLSCWTEEKLQIHKSIKGINTKTGKAELSNQYIAAGLDGGIAKAALWDITWVVDDQLPRQVALIGTYNGYSFLDLNFKPLLDRADRASNLMEYFGKGEGELSRISDEGKKVDLEYEYRKGSGDWRRNRFVLIGEMTTENRNYWIYGQRK